MSEKFCEKDCTPKCRSGQHASLILNCCAKATFAETRAFCKWLCHSFTTVVDKYGRNLLHMAASCGKWEVIQWLLDHCHCELDVRDAESGWTALHRSFFYGQLSSAQVLLNHGAKLFMSDHDGITPLDLIVADRLPYVEYAANYPQDAYVWGSNSNYNLGLGHTQSRTTPDVMENFRKNDVHIKQVVMCKFHTCFLSDEGKLYTCGHGHGGRLGQGSEITALSPALVHGLKSVECQQVSSGQDHFVLLISGGQVWTCGTNIYHQLGQSPPPDQLLTPKPISLKFLKGKEVVGVSAARFHSAFFTKDTLYTFGLNAGQLGHPKGERTLITPRQVSGVYNPRWQLTHVVASDGATLCSTSIGDVFVLHEFQLRKIASKHMGIQKLAVVGGHLDTNCDAAAIRDGGGTELRILILAQPGKIYMWRETCPYLRRCLLTSTIQPTITDIHLNQFSVAMVTSNNQCYLGNIMPSKEKDVIKSTQVSGPKCSSGGNQFTTMLDKTDCYSIRAKRLPQIHRGTAIVSDSKGRNFAVLQACPKMGLLELPSVSISKTEEEFLRFFEERHCDNFCDVIIKVGSKEYPAHKFILASRSEYFKRQFHNMEDVKLQKPTIVIDNVVPEAFEQVLKFLYCNRCDFLIHGNSINWGSNTEMQPKPINKRHSDEKSQPKVTASKKRQRNKLMNGDPVKCMLEVSRKFNVASLTKSLENIELRNGEIHVQWYNRQPKLKFDRESLPSFCDVTLCSEDGAKFPCHQCILAAKSHYFQSMFSMGWLEKKQLESLTLSISSKVLNMLLRYFYTDWDYIVHSNEDPEFLCEVLAVADQLLIPRLKEMCEIALVNLLSLKNATDLVEFANIYNAAQLKRSCIDFICINLPAIVEAQILVSVSDDVMVELGRTYRQMIPSMRKRVIASSNTMGPSKDELEDIEKSYPVDRDFDIVKPKWDHSSTRGFESKLRVKRRTLSESTETEKEDMKGNSSSLGQKCSETIRESNTEIQNFQTDTRSLEKNNSQLKLKGLWCQSPLLDVDFPSVNDIQSQITLLQKSPNTSSNFKGFRRISQKQRKLLATNEKQDFKSHKQEFSSQEQSFAWGRTQESSTDSKSFWDSVATGELQSPQKISSALSSSPQTNFEDNRKAEISLDISLEAIQQAEEEKITLAQPKVKSLQLINIEEQAIGELLLLYRAEKNVQERIIVSRVLPEKTVNPIWKKQLIYNGF